MTGLTIDPPRAVPATGGMNKLASQKLAILIDDDNLSIYAEKQFGCRVDYGKLLDAINDRELVRAILYRPAAAAADHAFPPTLRYVLESKLGIEVKTPPKNVDCWLTVDAIAMAGKADVIALVAGDGDYEPLVHYLKAHGCRVEVWSWTNNTSKRLREAADCYFPIKEDVLRMLVAGGQCDIAQNNKPDDQCRD
jgi:uncharacterized LabA/DUF88 family protein